MAPLDSPVAYTREVSMHCSAPMVSNMSPTKAMSGLAAGSGAISQLIGLPRPLGTTVMNPSSVPSSGNLLALAASSAPSIRP